MRPEPAREDRPANSWASELHVEATADRQFGTNSYLVEDPKSHDAVIIDANLEPELMLDLVRRRGCRVRAILLTHTDIDHVAGLEALLHEFEVPVAVHRAERSVVSGGEPLRAEMGFPIPAVPRVESLEEGVAYEAGSLRFEVVETPGHSPGGVTLQIERMLFTGDALFAGSIGRADFVNSDPGQLLEAVRGRLMNYPDDFLVLSGHGPITTIGQEKRSNPFV